MLPASRYPSVATERVQKNETQTHTHTHTYADMCVNAQVTNNLRIKMARH